MGVVIMNYMSRKERKKFFREAGNDKYIALRSRPLRVKVYARVSTEHESQINALANQKEWYKSQIYSNWDFDPSKDMYVDEGITGTSATKRESFLQMIEDAKSDDCDFDIVITREVSRFARNVEETFKYSRELKDYGVGVFFINDNIWSFDDSTDGIIKLSIMASLAQSESKKISERSLAGQAVTREYGQPYGNGNILGYEKVPHRKNKDINPATGLPYKTTFTYKINEEQACVIRKIFELCLEGYGTKRIKTILIQAGYKTATGTTQWRESTINRILNNPTYMGYNAYGKSKVVDYLSHETEYEHDLDKLTLVKGDWEPIISPDDWYMAADIRNKKRLVLFNNSKDNDVSKYGAICANNMWLRKLQCQCGTGLRRNKWRSNKLSDEVIYGYACYNQINNGSRSFREQRGLSTDKACGVQNVQECKLELMAKRIFEIILNDRREAMQLALKMILDCYAEDSKDNSKEIAQLKKDIKEEEAGKLKAAMLAAKGLYDEHMLAKVLIEFDERIKAYNLRLASLCDVQSKEVNQDALIAQLNEVFEAQIDFSQPIISYDIVDSFVNKVICRENSEFLWILNFNKLANLKPIERINHLSEEYKKTLVVDDNFEIFLEFEIPFEECQSYMQSRGRRIVKRGWDTLKVKVALDKN